MTEPSFLRDTRAAYNSVAAAYAERFQGELAGKPLDRALFAAFAELVRAAGAPAAHDPRQEPGWRAFHSLRHVLVSADLPYGLLHPSWGAHEPG
jgi:hypothetical protein